MKVGTDGVLLGSWTPTANAKRILDIGTGTGLLALMLAQRSSAHVDAVELDAEAAQQAIENVLRSPFAERVSVFNADIRTFKSSSKYDLIVCNPPFFINSMRCPDAKRTQARHSDTLTAEALLEVVLQHLAPDGYFSVVYPVIEAIAFSEMAQQLGLHCVRQLDVCPTPQQPPKRTLMTFGCSPLPLEQTSLVIETARHCYTDEYRQLTKDFYLNF